MLTSYNTRLIGYSASATHKGGGSVDITDQIINAINDLSLRGGGKVLIEAGNYIISKRIPLKSNIELYGLGSVLLDGSTMVSANDAIFTNDSAITLSNVYIRNLTLKGRFTYGTAPNYAVNINPVDGIRLGRISNCAFEDLSFLNCFNSIRLGVASPNTNDLGASNSNGITIANINNEYILGGVQLYSCDNVFISNIKGNHFGDDLVAILSTVPNGSNNIIIDGIYGSNGRETNPSGVISPGIVLKIDGGSTSGINNVIARGIIAKNVYNGIWANRVKTLKLTDYQVTDAFLDGVYLTEIAKNSVVSGGSLYACNLSQGSDHAHIGGVNIGDTEISSNNIYGSNLTGNNERAICIVGSGSLNANSQITNNYIQNVGGWNIYTIQAKSKLANNTIIGSSNSTRGILLDGTATDNFGEYNRVSLGGISAGNALNMGGSLSNFTNNYIL